MATRNDFNSFIINNNPDFIFSIDLSGRITNANNTLCKALNLEPDYIIGKTFAEFGFPEELTKQWKAFDEKVYKTNGNIEEICLVPMPDGVTHIYRAILHPLHDDERNFLGIGAIIRDITIHKKAREEVESSREDFFTMIDNAPDIIAVHCAGKVAFINKIGFELLKATHREDIIGKPVMQFVHSDYQDLVKTRIEKAAKERISLSYAEERFICLDGSFLDVEVKAIPIKFENNDSVLLIARDISFRKQNERKLEESNDRFKILIELIPYIIILKDGNGRWLLTNKLAKKRYELYNVDWFGKTDEELAVLQPNFAKLHQAIKIQDEKAWALGNTFVFDTKGNLPNGDKYIHEITKVPLFETNGERKSLLTIVKDTTKRKLEEQHLKLLETAITNTNDAIVITEANTIELPGPKIIFVNDAYLKMTGYKRDEIIGKNPRILQGINTDKNELKRLRHALENNKPCRLELINYKKNGEEFWSSIAIAPVKNNEGVTTNWVAIKSDITEKRRYDQNIRQASIRAQENEKFFIGRELHDNIAQILVGSLMSLSSVKGSKDQDNERLKLAIEDVHNSIEEIRNLSHELAPSKFKSDNFILSIQQLLKSLNKDEKFKMITHFDKLNYQDIDSDKQLNLYRILQEQLQNIIKHASATEIQISIRNNDMLELRICDNGKGFNSNTVSNGIGLHNIKNRAEIYGGYSEIKSSEGNGCELIVRIPIT